MKFEIKINEEKLRLILKRKTFPITPDVLDVNYFYNSELLIKVGYFDASITYLCWLDNLLNYKSGNIILGHEACRYSFKILNWDKDIIDLEILDFNVAPAKIIKKIKIEKKAFLIGLIHFLEEIINLIDKLNDSKSYYFKNNLKSKIEKIKAKYSFLSGDKN